MDKFAGMKARSIGPAGMSGRVTSIDVQLSNPAVMYVGTASGGLWKSINGGVSFAPLWDEQPVSSIGAVAIDQRNPDVIWVATGEGNPRNSQNFGNGIYKSLDGGKTWQFLGLEKTSNIHRLILDPSNPNVAYAGVQGSAYGDHPERGVYKTTDGGKTWDKILYINERTGVSDMAMDPTNPNKLIVGMWEFKRQAWFFKSGGAGSGMYITTDGGKTWKQRTKEDGLPEGELGKMGFGIARSNPNVMYALIESKKNALYRSDDGGLKWRKTTDKGIGDRPFYYFDLLIDPKNENRVYEIATYISRSEDGGRNFQTIVPFSKVHSDYHAYWVHPDNPDFIILGNDGGLVISRDKAKTWQFTENLPVGQFYHINVDDAVPFNVYGGMQDNGSWRGPSAVWREGGIRHEHWEEVMFGDGFDVMPDRSNPRYGYAMSQGGNIGRFDNNTGDVKFIKPVHPEGKTLRYNWNSALAADPFDSKTIYYASQHVHKSTDRGDSWEIISPDLTTNDTTRQKADISGGLTFDATAAENYCTIIALAASPVQQGMLWAGTDDGNVQLTTDGGKTWTNVSKNIKGVPTTTWVPQIQASKYAAGEAFVVFDNHRTNDWKPYVFRTKDFGKTWESVVNDPKVGFCYAIAQDPEAPNLLFLGTETGLYVSIDAGKNWNKWKAGYPTVPTMDLVIHPRDHDLAIGTFGRAIYILDDIRPLRSIAQNGVKVLSDSIKVFPAPEAYLASYRQPQGKHDFQTDNLFMGENRPQGAMVSFNYLPKDKDKKDSVKVEIFDANRQTIRTFKAEAKAGINRLQWRLDQKLVRFPAAPKPRPDAPERGGWEVLPGTYTVRISAGKWKDSTAVVVKADPRSPITDAERKARYELMQEAFKSVNETTEAADKLRAAREKVDLIDRILAERTDDKAKVVKKAGKEAKDNAKKLLDGLIGNSDLQGIVRSPKVISGILQSNLGYFQTAEGMPTSTEQNALKNMQNAVKAAMPTVNDFVAKDWAAYQKLVSEADIKLF
ncbi:MAG: hypothetical protein EAZ70_11275 [Runella slithyformis]|nr:MAG: hypothetical protein EAY79_11565 [Runella slithyformis]TAF24809.1 MAG: hypothetical protein EAZ70_11275 [Runella slithyformis]TAF49652.1 MAG: hypothetical protein EAZ63_00775 [Runella slithyformis]TAF81058.1 MAG: hypothetical protein EAZ50_07390 [Runella slithyformis]